MSRRGTVVLRFSGGGRRLLLTVRTLAGQGREPQRASGSDPLPWRRCAVRCSPGDRFRCPRVCLSVDDPRFHSHLCRLALAAGWGPCCLKGCYLGTGLDVQPRRAQSLRGSVRFALLKQWTRCPVQQRCPGQATVLSPLAAAHRQLLPVLAHLGQFREPALLPLALVERVIVRTTHP